MEDVDIDSCDDDESFKKPSLLEIIRSSEAVESISFFKRMNPFTRWRESKYRSQQILREGNNGKYSHVTKTGESHRIYAHLTTMTLLQVHDAHEAT
jgi:hypothetical protein